MRILPILLATLALNGCGGGSNKEEEPDPTEALVEDGTDASEVESQASALTATTTLATARFEDPARAAESAAANTKMFFLPSGCATSEADPNDTHTVVHSFNACSGPWGLRKVTGKVSVRYSATLLDGEPALQLDVTGDDLVMKKATADFHATAVVRATGADRKMMYRAELTGTTTRGRPLSRTANWTQEWRLGEQCISLTGTTDGTVNTRTLKTSVEKYQRCRNECPAAGGVITVEDSKRALKVRIEFTGEAVANVTLNDKQSQVPLACGLL